MKSKCLGEGIQYQQITSKVPTAGLCFPSEIPPMGLMELMEGRKESNRVGGRGQIRHQEPATGRS